jgi:hypothetical protein
MRFGVPVLANNRAGICEKGIVSIPRDAMPTAWTHTIEKIYRLHPQFVERSQRTFEAYDTPAQLKIYSDAVEAALKQ